MASADALSTATGRGTLAAIMSSPKTKSGEPVDLRTTVLPLSAIAAAAGVLLAVGMWIQQVNNSRAEASDTGQQLATVSQQLSEMQGSINALMSMQTAIADTRAEVGSLDSRMDSFDTRLQTMDAWIQTTRQKLAEQGMQAPSYTKP